jgi:parvulin-like peptidyl-prolyl isomerase
LLDPVSRRLPRLRATPVLAAAALLLAAASAFADPPEPGTPSPAPAPAPSGPGAPPAAALPEGVVAKVGDRVVTVAEFRAVLGRRGAEDLSDAKSSASRVFGLVVEETVVRQEAARLGMSATADDVERLRKELDDDVRRESNGTQTLEDVRKIQKMSPEEFRLRLEDQVRKEKVASHPTYLGATLPKEQRARAAQIEIVMGEIMKKAKIARTGLPAGVVATINGEPLTEEAFGAALEGRLAVSEVRRALNEHCFSLLLSTEAAAITDPQVEDEIEAAKPVWDRFRAEAVDPQMASLPFEAFLQMRFGATVEELRKSPYRRGIWALRRRMRLGVTDDDVTKAWVQGAKDLYGESVAVTEVVVSFRASQTVMESVKRKAKEDALRVVRDFARRLAGGEPAEAIEKDVKALGDRGIVFQKRALLDRGNDLLLFGAAKALADGAWSEPIETISEYHLLRRDALRPAPAFEAVRDLVRENVVDTRTREWLAKQVADKVVVARR